MRTARRQTGEIRENVSRMCRMRHRQNLIWLGHQQAGQLVQAIRRPQTAAAEELRAGPR